MTLWKSQLGVKQYEDLGLPYPDSMFDKAYEKFLKMTRDSKPEDNKTWIKKIVRLWVAEGQEYIIYDIREQRNDGIGNERHFNRECLGQYSLIGVKKEIFIDDEGKRQIRVIPDSAHPTGIAYEIPFSRSKLEEMHKYCNDKASTPRDGKTQYLVEKLNQRTISVSNYNDFLNGDFETLYQHGYIPVEVKNRKKEQKKLLASQLEKRARAMVAAPKQEVNY